MKYFAAVFFALGCFLNSPVFAKPSVDLIGIVNVPGVQGALLRIGHTARFVQTGEQVDGVEVRDVDLKNEIVRVRFEGEERTNRLAAPIRPATAKSWLHFQNADLRFLLQVGGELSGRVILLHPTLANVSISCEAAWTNQIPTQTEITDCFALAVSQRDATVTAEGDKFLQIIPTSIKVTASPHSKGLTNSAVKQSSMIDFQGAEVSQVLEIYGKLLGRHRTGNESVRSVGPICFVTSQPLSKAEAIYAFETLLVWSGNKIVLNGDDTFSIAKISQPQNH